MSKTIKIFSVLFLFVGFYAFAHPIKLSVCDVEYQNDCITMHYKLYQDDFIAFAKTQANVDFDKMNKATNQFVIDYLNKHTSFKINGQAATLTLKSYSKDATLVHIWLECKKVKLQKENKIEIKNTILFEQFPEQINMYYIDLLGDKNYVSCRLGKMFTTNTWYVPFK